MTDEIVPSFKQTLDRCSSIFLKENAGNGELFRASREYYDLLCQITRLEMPEIRENDAIMLPSGKAIGPIVAAECIKDYMRTYRFIRGLYGAVCAIKKEQPQQPVHLLYAGTGPFATLALPLTSVFGPEAIQFTFLEIQPESYQMVQKTIDAFGLNPYIRAVHLVDACSYQPDAIQPINIVLSETMQAALDKEPQVAITHHLSRFIAPGGHLIPQKISVWAGLSNPGKEMSAILGEPIPPQCYKQPLKMLLELDQHAVSPGPSGYPPIDVELSAAQLKDFPQLNLYTEIQVFDQEIIRYRESGLTLSKKIDKFDVENLQDHQVRFQYRLGANPGFEYTLLA